VLFLLPPTEIECGKLLIELKGATLAAYNGTINSDITSFKYSLTGSKGKPTLTKYYNRAGEMRQATLLLNNGAGFVQADMAIESEPEDKTTEMIEVMG
jgi:hypothetical protein